MYRKQHPVSNCSSSARSCARPAFTRGVAPSRRVSGFQFQAPAIFCPQARGSQVRCVLHCRSSGGAEHAISLGVDASLFDPDARLPPIPETNASKSGRERTIQIAERDGLTVRELAQRLGGYSGAAFIGTAESIADEMRDWLETEAATDLT